MVKEVYLVTLGVFLTSNRMAHALFWTTKQGKSGPKNGQFEGPEMVENILFHK